jgi:hypothetical protein
MAKKYVVELDVDASAANKAVDGVGDKVKNIGEQGKKSAEKASSGFKKMAETITKSLGVVTLIAGALNIVKDIIAQNQKVVDFFSVAFGVLADTVRAAFDYITNNAGKVVEYFEAIFDDPVQSLIDFGNAIKENIIERFVSLGETLGLIGKAVAEFFAGEFSQSWDTLKQAGKESIDVLTGVDNTVDKVSEAVSEAADTFGKFLQKSIDSNKALVQLQNNAKIAAAEQQRLAEQYDRSAELLRQARDDERKSIDDRIKANDELANVLDKQEKAELAAANAQISAAQATYQHNQTIDNQVALTQALAAADGVRAKIAGLRSEQQMNDLALSKEKNELLKKQAESEAQLDINQQKFYASRIKNDENRINALIKIAQQERAIELQRLQEQIDTYAVGTQARLDAEIEYAAKKQEIDQQIITLEDDKKKAVLDRIKTEAENEKKWQEQKYELAKLAVESMMSLNDLLTTTGILKAEESFKVGKALAIAQTTISTIMGVQEALGAKSVIPEPFGSALKTANAIAIGVAGAANIAKIAATKFNKGGGGSAPSPTAPNGGGGGMGGSTNAPALDLSFINQQTNQPQPLQAYVLATNVSSAQEANEKIKDQSRIIK